MKGQEKKKKKENDTGLQHLKGNGLPYGKKIEKSTTRRAAHKKKSLVTIKLERVGDGTVGQR